MKLQFAGRNFRSIAHPCCIDDYNYVKETVANSATPALKTHALTNRSIYGEDGVTHILPFEEEAFTYKEIDPNWTKSTLEQDASVQVNNKIMFAARVIWYNVYPVPKKLNGEKEPKVFCCIYHQGEFVFFCDFKDFEREFSFEREIKMYQVASKLEEGQVITEEQLKYLKSDHGCRCL